MLRCFCRPVIINPKLHGMAQYNMYSIMFHVLRASYYILTSNTTIFFATCLIILAPGQCYSFHQFYCSLSNTRHVNLFFTSERGFSIFGWSSFTFKYINIYWSTPPTKIPQLATAKTRQIAHCRANVRSNQLFTRPMYYRKA